MTTTREPSQALVAITAEARLHALETVAEWEGVAWGIFIGGIEPVELEVQHFHPQLAFWEGRPGPFMYRVRRNSSNFTREMAHAEALRLLAEVTG